MGTSSKQIENPDSSARKLKALRLTLRLPATGFAELLGMGLSKLHSRERGRAPWRPEEIASAQAKVRAHLMAGLEALEATKT